MTDFCGEEQANKKYRLCTDAKSLVLVERRLFPCCKAPQLCELGVFEATDENSVDCFTEAGVHERLRKGIRRLAQCGHIDICHHCYGFPHTHPEQMVTPAIQVSNPFRLEIRRN